MTNTRVAIAGYGNLGKAVELAILKSTDMEPVAVFTRREPSAVVTHGTPVYPMASLSDFVGKVDVCICCGGSATDLNEEGPQLAQFFNTVDSYDTHARIPEYFADMDAASKANGHVSMISTGWDPGLFSLNRMLGEAILPHGVTYTFWGKGVSQGHGDALRRVPGVLNAVQYTVPVEETKALIMDGQTPELTTRQKHRRECYVVAADGADQAEITATIVNMPNYFADYDTTVHFISAEELAANHSAMPHGGTVIRSGELSEGVRQVVSFNLNLSSNPEFTGSVAVACARAVTRLYNEGARGCMTMFDVPLGYLSPKSDEELRRELL